jgi:hypothetical protein
MSEFKTCSRGEFIRRAKLAFPFLGDETISKIIARGFIFVEKPKGGSHRYTEQSWRDLHSYVELRSRKAQALRDVAGRPVIMGAQ